MAEMTDYEKRRMTELENFKSAINGLIQVMDVGIGWIWVFVSIGFPMLIYFKPLNIEGVSGAIGSFIFFSVLALISIIWRKLGVAAK